MTPSVSVLIPVFNGGKYLETAIKSILAQTFTDFEILITDDGSTDDSLSIINKIKDSRIKCIVHEKNMGLIYTRNEAFQLAKGTYIAFLDSDDIAIPTRFKKQVTFLENNPDFGMIGTWISVIDGKGEIVNNCIAFPATPMEIPIILLFKNYFTTSSVMIRKSCLPDNPFDPEFYIAEDYNVWLKIAEKYNVWNLPEVLTNYRIHEDNIHKKLSQKMRDMDMLQLSKQLSKFNVGFTEEEKWFLFVIGKIDYPEEYAIFLSYDFVFADSSLNKLLEANDLTHNYQRDIIFDYFFKLWMQLFVSIARYDMKLFHEIRFSAFYRKISLKKKLKFFIKCLMNLDKTKN